MKSEIEKRSPAGAKDKLALAVTTFGVGYLPLAPGTWGSFVGVAIYLGVEAFNFAWVDHFSVAHGFSKAAATASANAVIGIAFLLFCLLGIWASGRSTEFFGNTDPRQAVVDEVIGMLITFLFIPFTTSWHLMLAGFLFFRLFDIWKPYPIDDLQGLPAGIGVCADDILAGVYAGVCLAIIHAVTLAIG